MSELSYFLEDQLKFIFEETVKEDFPEMLMGSGAMVDIETRIPLGAKTYSYKILTYVGQAVILADGATDIPAVNAFCEERTGHVRVIANKYYVTVKDLEYAMHAGEDLDTELGIGCREIIEKRYDVLGYDGDPKYNLLGFLKLPNVPIFNPPNDGNENGGVNSTEFQHKTAVQIYRDLRNFIAATRVATRGTYRPEILCLPEEQFTIVMETPYPDQGGSDANTIGSFLLKTQSYSRGGLREIVPADYLAGKGTGGTDMMTTHIKRDRYVRYHLVQDFEQRPPSPEVNMQYEVTCRMETGGVENKKPLTIRYGEGI